MAFTDNFSGTAGDFLVGRTGWTKFGSGADDQSPQINGSNQLRVPSYGAEDAPLVGQEPGGTDHYVEFTALAQFPFSGSIRLRVGVRCWDRNEGWWATYNASEGVWELLQNNTRIATYSAAFASGTVVRMEAEGSAIRVKLNGVERLSATDTTHTGNIRVGILGTTAYGTGNDPIMDDWTSDVIGGVPADTENPGLTGALSVVSKTSTSISVTGPTGTDNVGVTAYEFSQDGGATWPFSEATPAHVYTGLTPLTSYDLRMRAKDAAGLTSPALSLTTSTYRAGALGSTILLTTGPVDGNPAGILYNDVVPGTDDAKWFSFRIVTQNLNGGTLSIDPDGTFTFTGAAAGSFTYQLEVDGLDVGSPQLVTLFDQTAYRPSSDVTTTGWTSTGANFFGVIDEAPSDDADYVTSPAVTGSPGPLVLGLSPSIPAGSRIARIRARRTETVGEIRQVFLDAGDVEVGATAWVALTTSFALYEPTVTLTGTATKIKLEVRA